MFCHYGDLETPVVSQAAAGGSVMKMENDPRRERKRCFLKIQEKKKL